MVIEAATDATVGELLARLVGSPETADTVAGVGDDASLWSLIESERDARPMGTQD
jgi:hypothetical protein